VNKSELVAKLAERLGGDRAVAVAAVNGVLEEIEGSVARGERVSLIGFGTFDRRERPARTGRNPQTGVTIQLAASSAPVFRPGAGFRSRVTQNGGSAATTAAVPEQAAPTDAAPKKKPGKKAAKKALAAASGPTSGKADARSSKKAPKKATAKNAKDGKKAAKKAR
jgi:DNA-binding protein HU-beta